MHRKQENKRPYKDNNQGFTLIEVMIALAVFAIGILGVYTLQLTAIKGNASARGITETYLSGMDKVEELMILPYTHASLNVGEHSELFGSFTQASDGIDNDGNGTADEAGESGYIDIEWTVQDNPMWGQTVKLVTVTVNSAVNGGRPKRISFDFLKAEL